MLRGGPRDNAVRPAIVSVKRELLRERAPLEETPERAVRPKTRRVDCAA